ncbi:MAG: sigma-54-dependent Fis family transcriptional regulator [Candidatus Eisenbacteria bacterium]|nr:sigma-54-dependent Fis family transcriptional regulator [Candidatus Eisenbacteria bacterium]
MLTCRPPRPGRPGCFSGSERLSETPVRILVADDDPDILAALRLLLRGEGFEVETATSPALVLHAVEQKGIALALLDMNYARDTTSGNEGLDLIERLRALDPGLPVLVMTAWGSVEGAVAAVRRGARDYVLKPWDNERLLQTIRAQIELSAALRRGAQLEQGSRPANREGTPAVVAESAAMRAVLDVAQRVGPSHANVLITGEYGAGCQTIARLIHTSSPRSNRPFVRVSATAAPANLFEALALGVQKGAFPGVPTDRPGFFEEAEGGTLLLQDVDGLEPGPQATLLRVLQAGEFARVGGGRARPLNFRLICVARRDMHRRVSEGAFLHELLLRLNTVEIHIPPLRERREDVPALAALFLRRFAGQYGRKLEGFSDTALHALLAHSWPGNAREMYNAIERAVLLSRGRELGVEELGLRAPEDAAPPVERLTLDEAERLHITRALELHGGNVSLAAKALGLSRSALYRRLERHGIRAPGT